MVKIAYDGEEVTPIAAGKHVAIATDSQVTLSQNSGQPMSVITYTIDEGPMQGRKISGRNSLQSQSVKYFKRMLVKAFGAPPDIFPVGEEFDPAPIIRDVVLGKKVVITVTTTHDEEADEDYSNIKSVQPYRPISNAPDF